MKWYNKIMVDSPTTIATPEISERERLSSDARALQTYEHLDGPSDLNVADFAAGECLELKLGYDFLWTGQGEEKIDAYIGELADASTQNTDPTDASVEYRLAEVFWLKAASRLVGKTTDSIAQRDVDEFQSLNNELYGTPDPEIVSAILAEVWADIEKTTDPYSRQVGQELTEGFIYIAQDGSEINIPALPVPEIAGGSLPQLSPEAGEWLKGYLDGVLGPVKNYFTKVGEELSSDNHEGFSPRQVAQLFREAVEILGLGDIEVVEDENARLLSWSSKRSAVIVGLKRANVKNVDELMGLFTHEVFWHGGRSANGRSASSESLSAGLFTLAEEGENPDYLTFEEGAATTLQALVADTVTNQDIEYQGRYLCILLAARGWTPRQVFEVTKRVRLIREIEQNGLTLADASKIATEASVSQVVRTFRGTPVDKLLKTTSGETLHYSKDLAYTSGQVRARNFFNGYFSEHKSDEDRRALMEYLLLGKFDPTNSRHRKFVTAVTGSSIDSI